MDKEIITNDAMSERRDDQGKLMTPLSKAVKAGGFLFISGMPPQDPTTGAMVEGDIKVQTKQVLENLKMLLEGAGSSMDKVVKSTVYCTNAAHFDSVNGIYRQFFTEDEFPARTFVTVGSWPRNFDIEIEVVAIA